ncbi:MAG: antibiotic biosynthesis monooxygenase [Gammaproteobacteria bacterium]|nr:antibiotic biosynthesis monooxygenase [Gammaproteobacteria bacterium]
MATTILLEATAKAGTGASLVAFFKSILADTRAYDGCIGVEVCTNQDEPDVVVLIERWESRAKYEKYLGWRAETGVVDKIVAQIEGAPSIRYFDPTDA